MLSIKQVHFSYNGQKKVLQGISMDLKPGEIFGIVGASGCGKSSLLKIISGFLDASKGTVYWNGERVPGPSERLIPGHPEIQLVNQDFNLDLFHTVRENIRVKILHLHEKDRERFCDELLDLVELTEQASQQARYLSGGEQQRVGIARAVVNKPPLLLADEPTGNLDPDLSKDIMQVFEAFNQVGVSVLVATHDLGLVARMKYRTLTLRQGKMINDGLLQYEEDPL